MNATYRALLSAFVVICTATALLLPLRSYAGPLYSVTVVSAGGVDTHGAAINNSGEVTGTAFVPSTVYPGGSPEAFIYSNGTVLDLGGTTSASGINDSGEVVGGTSSGGGSFLYSDGNVQYLHLPTLGGSGSGVIGINDSGQLTGNSSLAGNLVVRAFLYGNGSMVDLGTLGGSFSYAAAINNNGQVTGLSSTKFNAHAFLYSDGHMQDLGTLSGRENDFSQGIAINDLGEVVGYSEVDGDWRAFLYANGSMQDLGTLGGDASAAHGINDSGEVVGSSVTGIDGFAGSDAFLYDDGSMYNLTSLIGNEYSCVWLTSATAINNRGQILANGIDKINHNEYAFVLTPTNSPNSGENSSTVCAVSEPGTLGLFALGVTGLGVALRRRPLRRQ